MTPVACFEFDENFVSRVILVARWWPTVLWSASFHGATAAPDHKTLVFTAAWQAFAVTLLKLLVCKIKAF